MVWVVSLWRKVGQKLERAVCQRSKDKMSRGCWGYKQNGWAKPLSLRTYWALQTWYDSAAMVAASKNQVGGYTPMLPCLTWQPLPCGNWPGLTTLVSLFLSNPHLLPPTTWVPVYPKVLGCMCVEKRVVCMCIEAAGKTCSKAWHTWHIWEIILWVKQKQCEECSGKWGQ